MLLIVAKKDELNEDVGGHVSMSKQVPLTDKVQFF